MSLKYIRDTYGVPAKRGCRVEYIDNKTAIQGTITGSLGPYIRVRLDGDRYSVTLHPTWRIRYLDAQLKDGQQ